MCILTFTTSGTTSKQLDKETDAKPIAYGGMLLVVLAVVLAIEGVTTIAKQKKAAKA